MVTVKVERTGKKLKSPERKNLYERMFTSVFRM